MHLSICRKPMATILVLKDIEVVTEVADWLNSVMGNFLVGGNVLFTTRKSNTIACMVSNLISVNSWDLCISPQGCFISIYRLIKPDVYYMIDSSLCRRHSHCAECLPPQRMSIYVYNTGVTYSLERDGRIYKNFHQWSKFWRVSSA